MPKTVVGLFENAQLVDAAVLEIEALGFPRQEVRTMREPASFDATGVMSFPRIDFEVDLNRELTRIGATIRNRTKYRDKTPFFFFLHGRLLRNRSAESS